MIVVPICGLCPAFLTDETSQLLGVCFDCRQFPLHDTDEVLASQIIRLLEMAKDRSEVMYRVTQRYCRECWIELGDWDGCYCSNDE